MRRPNASFDGQTLQATTVTNTLGPAVANIAYLPITADADTAGSVMAGYSSITSLYSEYKLNWIKFHWLPAVSPGVAAAGGRIYAYTETNPERMVTLLTGSATSAVALTKTARNMHSWNAWERYTYNVPIMMRHRWFDVNTNIAYSADTADRSTQALISIGADTIGATDSLGQFQIEFSASLRGLNFVVT